MARANGRDEQVHIDISERSKDATGVCAQVSAPPISMGSRLGWWLLVALNIFFLLAGQTAAMLLGRFYYDQGGNSKWLATLVQTAGFPILLLPLSLVHSFRASPSSHNAAAASAPRPPLAKMTFIYVALGLIIASDNLMYSYGLLYLRVSTYSLVCASQLAFNAIFSYFINKDKFTVLIMNSVVVLTMSATLLGMNEESGDVPGEKPVLGFVLTLGASATYSLILSLMQFAFEKVIRRETFAVVLEMQICTSLVASVASVVGLLASGEWSRLHGEMNGYNKGRASYVLTNVGTAVSWQVSSIGVVGLIFMVSSLFSNAISTLALPVVPFFAVVFFHDKMEGVKIIALLLALWGFFTYLYQKYIDERKVKRMTANDAGTLSVHAGESYVKPE